MSICFIFIFKHLYQAMGWQKYRNMITQARDSQHIASALCFVNQINRCVDLTFDPFYQGVDIVDIILTYDIRRVIFAQLHPDGMRTDTKDGYILPPPLLFCGLQGLSKMNSSRAIRMQDQYVETHDVILNIMCNTSKVSSCLISLRSPRSREIVLPVVCHEKRLPATSHISYHWRRGKIQSTDNWS